MAEPIKVLFVCLGNICRSPTAQGVFAQKVKEAGLSDRISIDSAGVGHWHVGKSPDPRAMEAASSRGLDLSDQIARTITSEDFGSFDYIMAMDRDNLSELQKMAPPETRAEIELFLDYAHHSEEDEVPDPYYGGPNGFERVLNLVSEASDGLLNHIQNQLGK